jgi:YHS domain-containing protein
MVQEEKSPSKCALCGKKVINQTQRKETIMEIGGTNYTFDSNECALMFKKFRSVYGPEIFETC